MVNLTFAEVSALLAYDPTSGTLTWKVKRNGRDGGVNPGDCAGCKNNKGYLSVGLNGSRFLAHRLAWLLHYRTLPEGSIDHIDGDRSNNRIENLRDVSHSANLQNRQAKAPGNKSTGLLGASKCRERYVSYIHREGKKVHLGVFDTAEAAHAAHVAARRAAYEGNTL